MFFIRKSLSKLDALADTTTPHGRLMLTVLGGLAEFERELIRARTGDGRARAKARGVKFGRPAKLTAHQRREAIQRLAEGAAQTDLAANSDFTGGLHISMLARPNLAQLVCNCTTTSAPLCPKALMAMRSDSLHR